MCVVYVVIQPLNPEKEDIYVLFLYFISDLIRSFSSASSSELLLN